MQTSYSIIRNFCKKHLSLFFVIFNTFKKFITVFNQIKKHYITL